MGSGERLEGQEEMIKFQGSIYSTKTDREGYSKVTLEIPKSDLHGVLMLAQMTEAVLNFEVKREGEE